MNGYSTLAVVFAVLLVLTGSVGAVAVGGVQTETATQDAAVPGGDFRLDPVDDEYANVSTDDAPSYLTFDVTNDGDVAGNQTVDLTFDTDHDGDYDTVFGSRTVELAPGETKTLGFGFELEHEMLGTYHYRIASADDTIESTITNYCAIGFHDVTAMDAPSSVVRGDSLTVTATVERTHVLGSTQAVEFRLDANGDGRLETVDTERVGLSGVDDENDTADSETVTYTLDTSDLAPGAYDYAVLVGDDGQYGTLTVEAAERETAYYQVDLVVGEPNEVLGESTDDFYSPEGRLVAYLHGTSDDGVTRTATAGSLSKESDAVVEATRLTVADDGETATVTVTTTASLTLSLVSYEKPGVGFDRSVEQTMVDAETGTLDGDTYTFTVALPGDESDDEA